MSYRIEGDSWPYRGHERQGEADAHRRRYPDRDLYDRYGSNAQQKYVEGFDRERSRVEMQEREKREEERRREELMAEQRRWKAHQEAEREQDELEARQQEEPVDGENERRS